MELIHSDYVVRIYNELPNDLDNGILYRYSFNDLRCEPRKYIDNYQSDGALWLVEGIYAYEKWNGIDTRQLKFEPFYGLTDKGEYGLLGIKTIDINLKHYRVDLYSHQNNNLKESYICDGKETFVRDFKDNEFKSPSGIYFCGIACLDNLSLIKKIIFFNEMQKQSKSANEFLSYINDRQKRLQLSLNIV
jgi:hypothetical protein